MTYKIVSLRNTIHFEEVLYRQLSCVSIIFMYFMYTVIFRAFYSPDILLSIRFVFYIYIMFRLFSVRTFYFPDVLRSELWTSGEMTVCLVYFLVTILSMKFMFRVFCFPYIYIYNFPYILRSGTLLSELLRFDILFSRIL